MRKDLFTREDTQALVLGKACLKLFGTEFLEWEPKTVYESLASRGFGQVTRSNANKINSFRVAYNTLLPWVDWESFEKVGHGLLGSDPNFELREPLEVAECMHTVKTLNRIRVIDYSYDVRAYIVSCAKNEELEYLPDSLEFCMPLLCPPMYRCLDCGNTDTDDLDDGKCDVCVGRYEDGVPSDKPPEELKHLGANIQRAPAYSYAKIADMYRKCSVLSINAIQLGVDAKSIQVAKLLHVREFCSDRDFLLNQQMGLL
jgi:hypothetical protein